MRAVYFSLSGVANKVVPVDNYVPEFKVMIEVVANGTITYGVEETYDDIYDLTVTPLWSNSETAAMNPGAVATARGVQSNPCRAYRFSTTAGAGSINVKLIQQGTQ